MKRTASKDVAEAIQSLTVVAREAAESLTYVVHDGFATLNDSVRSAGAALVTALTRRPGDAANTNIQWAETDAYYAKANGGRKLRPMREKTTAEKANLERMRSRGKDPQS